MSRRSLRSMAVSLGVALILLGLTFAIIGDSAPAYHATSLATSGSFFALAATGTTLYAASDNGGSILLETSTDRGVDWTASPVPYSAVAGGAPWTYATVAADGDHLLLAAATGGSINVVPFPAGYPPVTTGPTAFLSSCGTNSTVLVASSLDGGLTWSTLTFVDTGFEASALQAGIDGASAAVAWLGQSITCGTTTSSVHAVTSGDSGRTWSSTSALDVGSGSVLISEGLEMAPELDGIMLGFGVTGPDGSSQMLSLWQLTNSTPPGFRNVTELPAPTSWTLQGDVGTPAFLLTPTYLIPLTQPPFTAMPFNQLQQDAGGIGVLPRVVSLVASGTGTVEIAATTPDNLGVDCWQVGWSRASVTQSCHVPLGSWLTPSASALPIVALIDGGGWWTAIGASGGCPSYCPTAGGVAAPVAGSAISTSVCVTGCDSVQGLEAYSYTPGTALASEAVVGWAPGLAGLGTLIVLVGVLLPRRTHRERAAETTAVAAVAGHAEEGASILAGFEQKWYLFGLGVWIAAWTPLAVLAFESSSGPVGSGWLLAVLGGGAVGAVVGYPMHRLLRGRLLAAEGIGESQLLGAPPVVDQGPTYDDALTTCQMAYASWGAAIAVMVLLWIDLASGGGGGAATASALLLVATGVWLVLRMLYHRGLAHVLAARRGEAWSGADRALTLGARTVVGNFLLPLNPTIGLVVGIGIMPWIPGAPYFLPLAMLPVTFLAIALLGGGFGRTIWSPRLITG